MWLHEMRYRAKSWARPRRVILVVKDREGDLLLNRFFLVTSLSWTEMTRREVLDRKGGGHLGEGNRAQVVGLLVARRIRGHVGQDQVRRT